jgi:hypothetical protein
MYIRILKMREGTYMIPSLCPCDVDGRSEELQCHTSSLYLRRVECFVRVVNKLRVPGIGIRPSIAVYE